MTINDYFDKIFCINLASRPDRWKHAQEEAMRLGLTKMERFEGYVMEVDGKRNGNAGCTASHRALLEIISYLKIERALILEDDFCSTMIERDINEAFDRMIPQVPGDWDLLYLGAHYQERPQKRISTNVIKAAGLLTTSSYAVTWRAARQIAPYISGAGPIDCLYLDWNRKLNTYIFQPRLMFQYASISDLTNEMSGNMQCMVDNRHELMV